MLRLTLRRLASERVAALGYALLVFATALAFAIAPRALEDVSNGALRQELAATASTERNLRIAELLRANALPLRQRDEVVEIGGDLRDRLPLLLQGLVTDQSFLVETPSWMVLEGTDVDSILSLRLQEGAEQRVTLVAGSPASGRVQYIEDPRPNAPPNQRAVVYEALMARSAAERMGVEPGERLLIQPGGHDPLMLGVNVGAELVITGLYEITDPADDFWLNDTTIAGFRYTPVSPTTSAVDTTVLIPLDAYGPLHGNTWGQGMPLRYEWRYHLDTAQIEATRIDAWTTALRRLESNPPRSGLTLVSSETQVLSGLLRVLERHIAAWQSATAILAVAGVGTAIITLATLAVVTMLASAGRRRVAALVRARGASLRQIAVPALTEGLLLCVPGVALGLLLAALLIPNTAATASTVPAVTIGALAALCLPLLVVPGTDAAIGNLGAAERAQRIVRGASPRRLVIETTLVIVAIGAAYLLRERGVGGPEAAPGAGATVTADPLLMLAPVLVGAAAGIVAVRVYPLIARAVDWIAALRRDLLPVLATRRVTRGASSTPVLLLLVATATMGAFAAATVAHLDHATVLSGWQQTGGDFRLRTTFGPLPPELDDGRDLAGVEAASGVALQTSVSGGQARWLALIDPASFSAVVAGTPADPQLPAELLAPITEQPLPALVWAGSGARLGQVLERQVGPQPVRVRVVGLRPHFPAVPVGGDFTVISAEQFEAVQERLAPPPNSALLRAPTVDDATMAAAVEAVAPGVIVDSRAATTSAVADAPVMGALRLGVLLLALVAIGYAALAVGAALALAGAARRTEVAHLRALGVGRRQAAWLLFMEYVPAAIVAYGIGVGLGIGLFVFVRPGLGLVNIVGSTIEVPLAFEPVHLLGLLLAIVAIAAVGWALGVAAQREADPATAVRGGIA